MFTGRPTSYEIVTLKKEPMALFLDVHRAREFIRETNKVIQGTRLMRTHFEMVDHRIKLRKVLYVGKLTIVENDNYRKKTAYLIETSFKNLYDCSMGLAEFQCLRSCSLEPYKAVYNPMKDRWDVVKSEYTKEW